MKRKGCDFFFQDTYLEDTSETAEDNGSTTNANDSLAERVNDNLQCFLKYFKGNLEFHNWLMGKKIKNSFSHHLYHPTSKFERKDQSQGHKAGEEAMSCQKDLISEQPRY